MVILYMGWVKISVKVWLFMTPHGIIGGYSTREVSLAMNHCEYCNAPLLSITRVCPNCHREQPPYPPVLPGGGGKSFRGWSNILFALAAFFLAIGIAMFFQAPYSVPSAYIFGSPSSYINTGTPTYLLANPDGSGGIYPGYGYLIFWGGIAVVLALWAFVSRNRGNRIDKANAVILRALQRNGNNNNAGRA
jgi:hypothetical protein